MKKFGGVALVTATCFIAVFTVFFSSLYFNMGGFYATANETLSAESFVSTESVTSDVSSETASVATESAQTSSTNDVSEADTSSTVSLPDPPSKPAVPAASPGQAVGKIVEQFMSPYNAALAYDKVYIKNRTSLSIDLKSEMAAPISLKINKSSEPEVLIVHTHATECYMYETRDYYTKDDATRSTDNSRNMVYIGEIIAARLKAAGISVIHDTTQHDNPSYTGSYANAEKTIQDYLKKYPSIKVVLDVHRDSVALNDTDKVRPVVTIDGKRAAQVMLVMGCEDGTVTGFPNWRENFRLACQYQKLLETDYPGLARTMTFAAKKYNEHLTTGSMLLEVGTETNTYEEAAYAAQMAGDTLAKLLNSLQ